MKWEVGKKFKWKIGIKTMSGIDDKNFGEVEAEIISDTHMKEKRIYKNGNTQYRLQQREKYNLDLLEEKEI